VVVPATAQAIIAVVALAAALGGWMRGPATPVERIVAGVAGALLCYASPTTGVVGLTLFAVAIAVHLRRLPRP
jgi:TRAP-type uncharacterized transport system fused permease subunit